MGIEMRFLFVGIVVVGKIIVFNFCCVSLIN